MDLPKLVLRCFAEPKNGQWQAFCLELDLAAQGDSFQQVRQKLDEMICSYVEDALVGEDREFGMQLLFERRAPASLYLKYYTYKALGHTLKKIKDGAQVFQELLPLGPVGGRCRHA